MLAIWASAPTSTSPAHFEPIPGLAICAALGIGNDTWTLALEAWRYVYRNFGPHFADAEAEALLRTGWRPR